MLISNVMASVAEELEQRLAQAVKDGKIPHAIVYATNRDGSFQYQHATGLQHYGVDEDPIQEDAVLMLASQTKLLTSIAALQAVEQGVIGLDDDVSPTIPELGQIGILKGFDKDDTPILEERKKIITLRRLLTHSSGANYMLLPDTIKHQMQRGRDPQQQVNAGTILGRFDTALHAEPGDSWLYSPGLDWTGLLLHRLTGLDLEAWLQKHICAPLNLTGMTFRPKTKPSLSSKIPQLVKRTESGTLVPDDDTNINTHSIDCFGGQGVYAKMGDYIAVLHSLLADDGRLLKPESVDEMFRPQLGEGSQQALRQFVRDYNGMLIGEYSDEIPVQHGLGGVIFLEDDLGRRKKGTMSWGGLVNTFWLIDREAGVALTFGTQVMPPGDKYCKEITGIVERAVYKMAGLV